MRSGTREARTAHSDSLESSDSELGESTQRLSVLFTAGTADAFSDSTSPPLEPPVQRQRDAGALLATQLPWISPAELQPAATEVHSNEQHSWNGASESASTAERQEERLAGMINAQRNAFIYHKTADYRLLSASGGASGTGDLPSPEDTELHREVLPSPEDADKSQQDSRVTEGDRSASTQRRIVDGYNSEDPEATRNLVRVYLKLTGHKLAAMGLSGNGKRSIRSFWVISQDGQQVARSNLCPGTVNPRWRSIRLALRSDQAATLDCWITNASNDDELIGTCQAQVDQLTTEKASFTLMNGKRTCGMIRVHSVKSSKPDVDGSVVNMLQREIFVKEGVRRDDEATEDQNKGFYVRFKVFRVYDLDQPLSVKYKTCKGLGSAKPQKHFIPTTGTAYFEAGSALTYFDVEILNDELWGAVRDFLVQITEVEGNGSIGALSRTTCHIVDDDLSDAQKSVFGSFDAGNVLEYSRLRFCVQLPFKETPHRRVSVETVRARSAKLC
jgi:hypothetical protein